MNVNDVYQVMKKNELWSFIISDMSGKIIAYCNGTFKFEDVPAAIRNMTVEEIDPCTSSLYVKISFIPEASYLSEERCQMDGYEKLFNDSIYGPVYAKECQRLNPHDGSADFIGYTYAVIQK